MEQLAVSITLAGTILPAVMAAIALREGKYRDSLVYLSLSIFTGVLFAKALVLLATTLACV